jgi:hypothetical protein
MDQNQNTSSASAANSNDSQDNTAPAYQLAIQSQLLQWIATMQNPYATQWQNSGFSQQPRHPNLPNGIASASPMQHYLSLDNLGSLPANVADNVFRMTHPVGSSPNDDSLLAQALHDSAKSGKTYRQAIEGLHGVRRV